MILADYFNTSYQVLVESNIKNINNNLMMLIFDYNNFKGTKHIHVEYNVLFLCFILRYLYFDDLVVLVHYDPFEKLWVLL